MPAAKCAICGKTAYPLESVNAIEKTYHKACFKCAVCRLQLTLTNFVGEDGKVYCKKHAPVAKATAVTDTVAIRQATHAPKRVAEGLGTAQKGTGEKPRVAGDSLAMQHAKAAPKRTAEGLGTVQKGTGGKPTVMVFGATHADGTPLTPQSPSQYDQPADSYEEQPAESYEQPAESYDQPAETYEEQPAEEQPAEEYYEEQPAEGGEEYYEEQPAAEGGGEEYYEEQY